MTENLKVISDSEFEGEVLKSTIPVLVLFWAQWCGPCRAIIPVIEKIIPRYEGKIKFIKIDIDENTIKAGSLGISAIPTLIFFTKGKSVDQLVGLPDKDKIERRLQKMLVKP